MKSYSFTSMEEAPFPNWVKIKSLYPVKIPNPSGEGFSHSIEVEIDAWRNEDGEVFIPGDISVQLEDLQARLMGLLSPEEMKTLRLSLGQSQAGMSRLLQLGAKTWHRWETGKERPSRAHTLLLKALRDRHLSVAYLEQLLQPVPLSAASVPTPVTEEPPTPSPASFLIELPAANEELALAA